MMFLGGIIGQKVLSIDASVTEKQKWKTRMKDVKYLKAGPNVYTSLSPLTRDSK